MHQHFDDTSHDRQRWLEGMVFFVLFCLTIPAATWMIGNVGTVCLPAGPCLIPVAPGLVAPSGVLMVGAALVLRDLVQRRLGAGIAVVAILIGSLISGLNRSDQLANQAKSGLSFRRRVR